MITVKCIHCGEYEPNREQLFDLSLTSLLKGTQCYNCSEEVYIYIDGKRATTQEIRERTKQCLTEK